MSQNDRHLTTEELSSSLDGQLTETEQAQRDEHLKTCEECQLKLADLRETVAVLHALPQPRLPRSFVLSAEAVATPLTAHREERGAPQTISKRRRRWPTYIQTTIRTMSTLAAMVGIVLVLAGLLSVVPHGGGAAATSGSVPMAAPAAASTANSEHSSSGSTTQSQAKTAPSATTTAKTFAPNAPTPTAQPTSPPENTGMQQPQDTSVPEARLPAFLDLNTAAGRTSLGILLLVLSIVGFVLLARQRKHANEG